MNHTFKINDDVQIHVVGASPSLASWIRQTCEMRYRSKEIIEVLDKSQELLSVAGANDPVATIKALHNEITSLRRQLQLSRSHKGVEVENEDDPEDV